MATNRYKEKNMEIPIENNNTAAWANIERIETPSNVTIPSLLAVEEAKEFVEENEK